MKAFLAILAMTLSLYGNEANKTEANSEVGIGIGIEVGPDQDGYYDDDGYYEDGGPEIWVGPGYYGGVWFDDEGSWRDHHRDHDHDGRGRDGGHGGGERRGGGGRGGHGR